jgi:hypothetical protein
LTESVFVGPEQSQTAFEYWRGFSNSILQWTDGERLAAFVYDAGTEKMAGNPDSRQALWMGSAVFTRWHVSGPWSLALRPEVYWDPDGRMTGNRQLIKAITTTVEYRIPLGKTAVDLRLEYRHDNSTGPGGGFFNPEGNGAGLLTGQNVLFMSFLWGFASTP